MLATPQSFDNPHWETFHLPTPKKKQPTGDPSSSLRGGLFTTDQTLTIIPNDFKISLKQVGANMPNTVPFENLERSAFVKGNQMIRSKDALFKTLAPFARAIRSNQSNVFLLSFVAVALVIIFFYN